MMTGLSQPAIRTALEAGQLVGHKEGNKSGSHWIIRVAEIDAWLARLDEEHQANESSPLALTWDARTRPLRPARHGRRTA
jgi:hypothetical protein